MENIQRTGRVPTTETTLTTDRRTSIPRGIETSQVDAEVKNITRETKLDPVGGIPTKTTLHLTDPGMYILPKKIGHKIFLNEL